MEINPPQRIYQYEILDLVGRGKNGTVCKGRDTARETTVAIKLFRPEVAADSNFVKRTVSTLNAARDLNHPNLAGVLEVIKHEGEILLVTEFVDGTTLEEKLRNGPTTPSEFLELADQAARGLSCLHAAGLVHGNVQPSNLMISPNGVVKLTDFGQPRRLANSHPDTSGFRPGTAHYASPEEANDEKPTPASDLFSLGIVFYEMLTGKLPFPGESVEELLRQTLTFRPDFGLISRHQAPGEIVLMLKRLLGVKPEERCTEVSELIATLEAAQTLQRELSRRDESGPKQQSARVYLLFSLLAVLMVLLWSILAEYR